MKYSIIFLIEEEKNDFAEFFDMIQGIFGEISQDCEFLVVANGRDRFVRAQFPAQRDQEIKVITFQRNVSQTVCLKAALNECRGSIIMTLGAFQELTIASYGKLINSMTDRVDIILPCRKLRKDPILNRLHSKLLNIVVKRAFGIEMNDIGCNVKLMKREVLEGLELYGNMYKYLPVLAFQKGFKIKEIECDQIDKIRKISFYNWRLYLDRFIEILNLFFSTKFSKKPLRFFNLVGTGFIMSGMIALIYIGIQKIIFDTPIGARPLLMIGMILLVVGAQIASFGLLGEIISFVNGRSNKEYTIEKII